MQTTQNIKDEFAELNRISELVEKAQTSLKLMEHFKESMHNIHICIVSKQEQSESTERLNAVHGQLAEWHMETSKKYASERRELREAISGLEQMTQNGSEHGKSEANLLLLQINDGLRVQKKQVPAAVEPEAAVV